MLIVLIIITAVIVLTVLSVFVSRLINSYKNKIDTKTGIQESTYIDIDGMKQYVQIRGKNTKNPVMIFIHGGPASPMGYVSAYYQRELESELTIINNEVHRKKKRIITGVFAADLDSMENLQTFIQILGSNSLENLCLSLSAVCVGRLFVCLLNSSKSFRIALYAIYTLSNEVILQCV